MKKQRELSWGPFEVQGTFTQPAAPIANPILEHVLRSPGFDTRIHITDIFISHTSPAGNNIHIVCRGSEEPDPFFRMSLQGWLVNSPVQHFSNLDLVLGPNSNFQFKVTMATAPTAAFTYWIKYYVVGLRPAIPLQPVTPVTVFLDGTSVVFDLGVDLILKSAVVSNDIKLWFNNELYDTLSITIPANNPKAIQVLLDTPVADIHLDVMTYIINPDSTHIPVLQVAETGMSVGPFTSIVEEL